MGSAWQGRMGEILWGAAWKGRGGRKDIYGSDSNS